MSNMKGGLLALGCGLLIASLAVGACGGGGSSARSDDTANSSETPLALNEYLIRILKLEGEWSQPPTSELEDALAFLLEDPEQFFERSQTLFREALQQADEARDAVSRLMPPPEAADYHERLVAFTDSSRQLLQEASASSEQQDPDRILEILDPGLSRLNSDFFTLAQLREGLVIKALEADAGDPLSAYLISVTRLRREIRAGHEDVLRELLTTPRVEQEPELILQLVEELSRTLDQRWSELAPPLEAEALRQREHELRAETLDALRSMVAALHEEDFEAWAASYDRARDLRVQEGELEEEWDVLFIQVLSP